MGRGVAQELGSTWCENADPISLHALKKKPVSMTRVFFVRSRNQNPLGQIDLIDLRLEQ